MGDAALLQRVARLFAESSMLSVVAPPLEALYSLQAGGALYEPAPNSGGGSGSSRNGNGNGNARSRSAAAPFDGDWALHLSTLVANAGGSVDATKAMLELGQALRSRSTCASHVCFLAAGCQLGRPVVPREPRQPRHHHHQHHPLTKFNRGRPPIVLAGSAIGLSLIHI